MAIIFCGYNNNLHAISKTFTTVTEAVNYSGADKNQVTHITISGNISGNNYFPKNSPFANGSEWGMLINLNTNFTKLESIEILTNQKLPDHNDVGGSDGSYRYSLFSNWSSVSGRQGAKWLKHFRAPHITSIPNSAFHTTGLISVTLPNVSRIEAFAFQDCNSLTKVELGTEFVNLKSVNFGVGVFNSSETPKADLTLGSNARPLPNLTNRTWNGYTWKSITVEGANLPKFTLSSVSMGGGKIITDPANTTDLDSGTIVALLAIPNNCMRFVNWLDENHNEVSTQNPLIVTLASDTTLKASFTMSHSPPEGFGNIVHTISGIGGDLSIMKVEVNGVNAIVWDDDIGWYIDIIYCPPAGTEIKFSVDSNKHTLRSEIRIVNSDTLVAEFTTEENPFIHTIASATMIYHDMYIGNFYHIADEVNPAEAGTVEGFGKYRDGDTVTLTAIPKAGYLFENWTWSWTGKLNNIDTTVTFVSTENPIVMTFGPFGAAPDTNFPNWLLPDAEHIQLVKANFIVDTVSVQENNLISSIRILPNPVHNDAIIAINCLESQPNTVITILDISGREIITVYSGMLNEGTNNFSLSTSSLPNGTYFVLVQNKNGQKTEQFIIAR